MVRMIRQMMKRLKSIAGMTWNQTVIYMEDYTSGVRQWITIQLREHRVFVLMAGISQVIMNLQRYQLIWEVRILLEEK
jgi:hypothetical protein